MKVITFAVLTCMAILGIVAGGETVRVSSQEEDLGKKLSGYAVGVFFVGISILMEVFAVYMAI